MSQDSKKQALRGLQIELMKQCGIIHASDVVKQALAELAFEVNASESEELTKCTIAVLGILEKTLEELAVQKPKNYPPKQAQKSFAKIVGSSTPTKTSTVKPPTAAVDKSLVSKEESTWPALPNSNDLVAGWVDIADKFEAEAKAKAEAEAKAKAEAETGSVAETKFACEDGHDLANVESDGFEFEKKKKSGFKIDTKSLPNLTSENGDMLCTVCDFYHLTLNGCVFVDIPAGFRVRSVITPSGKTIKQFVANDFLACCVKTCGRELRVFFGCRRCEGRSFIVFFEDIAVILSYCVNCLTAEPTLVNSIAVQMTSTDCDKNALVRHITTCIKKAMQAMQAMQKM